MGADFLLFSLPWAELTEARQKLLHDTIDQLADEDLREIAEAVGTFDDADLSEVRAALHTAVGEYMALDHRRDTTTWRHGGDPITRIFTGGLSWGEPPTECCQTFDILVACEPLFELIEGWAEADAAHSQPANPLQAVLAEFRRDVEAVGREHLAEQWPDLAVTYDKAVAALAGTSVRESQHTPDIVGIMGCICNALTDAAHGVNGCVIESSDNDHDDGEIFISHPDHGGGVKSYFIKIAPDNSDQATPGAGPH